MPKTMNEKEKREKARRVWRLNHDGEVPVMEALESVGLSKDVYYRIKREREEVWEEEVLTAEDLSEELVEVRDEIEELSEKVERQKDAVQHVDENFGTVEDLDRIRVDLERFGDELIVLHKILDKHLDTDIHHGIGFKPTTEELQEADGRELAPIEELEERIEGLEQQVAEQKARQDELAEAYEGLRDDVNGLKMSVGSRPDSLLALLKRDIFGR